MRYTLTGMPVALALPPHFWLDAAGQDTGQAASAICAATKDALSSRPPKQAVR